MQLEQDIIIPPSRQDLKVYKGGLDHDGAPTWMLYDPLSDNYFKIGWFEFECLQRFERCRSASQLRAAIHRETALRPELDDVKDFIGFMAVNNLLIANTPEIQKIIKEKDKRPKKAGFMKLFSHYLYVAIPLFRPERFLNAAYPYIKFLFTRWFFYGVLVLLTTGIFLTLQRWDEFLHTFGNFFSLEGLALVILTTVFIKIFHELGHAFMAHKYGVPVSTMGVTLIVLYPVLYTETTNAWRLFDRKKRLYIAAAGLMAELTLASIALIVWHISSPGLLQNTAYFIAFVSLLLSVAVNMNPLMRFDGYYLLSDTIGMDNLHTRATGFFKWKLREVLLGLKEDRPEPLSNPVTRFMTVFGTALNIYRLFLFSGIALAVYAMLFKPLDIILAGLVMVIFVGAPIAKEILFWVKEREKVFINFRARAMLATLAMLLILAFLPLQTNISVPAVYHARTYADLFAPVPAKITEIKIQSGQRIKKNDILFILSSDQLEKDIRRTKLSLDFYKTVKERQQASRDLSRNNKDIDLLILEAQTQLNGLLQQKETLTIRAPFDGEIRDMPADLHSGRWVNQETLLGRIIDPSSLRATGYAAGDALARIKVGAAGRFMADASLGKSIEIEVEEIAATDTRALPYPELSSLYGGSIPVDEQKGALVARIPLYALAFKITDNKPPSLDFTKTGTARLHGQPVSIAGKISKKLASIFIRETGF